MGFNFPSSPTLDQPFNEFGIAWFYNGYAWRLVKVTGDPTLALDLDFTTGTLDSKVTFSRTTHATVIDSAGKVQWAVSNYATNSDNFGAWALDGVSNAANTITEAATTALHRFYINHNSAQIWVNHTIEAKYIDCPWIFIESYGGNKTWFNIQTGVVGSTQSGVVGTIEVAADGYYRCTAAAVRGASVAYFVIGLAGGDGVSNYLGTGRKVAFRRAQLDETTYRMAPRPYLANPTGSPAYGPRFDHDPVTLVPRGLLLEEQRTNYALQSQNFAAANWIEHLGTTKTGVAPVVDPAGGSNAYEVAFGSSTGAIAFVSALYQGGGAAAGDVILSCWVRAKTGTGSIRFSYYHGGGDTLSPDIAISTTWQRISHVWVGAGSGTGNFALRTNSTGTTGSVYLFGFQVENGVFASSYILTTTASVTRAADSAVMTGTGFSSWYTAGEGTFLMEGTNDARPTSTAQGTHYLNISDGSSANRMLMYNGLVDQIIGFIVGSVSTTIASLTTDSFKLAMALKANDVAFSLNSSAPVTDTSAFLLPADRLHIGLDETAAAGRFVQAHVKRLRYYNVRKTNAELQALTYPFADLTQTLDLDFTLGALDPRVTFSRTTTGTYTDRAGLIQTSGINGSRFDFDPVTHAGRGLLLEEQRTNLLLQSEAFNTTWGSTSTVTANQTTAPDGTMTGDKITLTTGGQYTQQNIYPGPSGTHAFSVYAKAGNTNFALVKLQQWGTPHYAVIVDLTTGLVTKTQGGIGVGSPAYRIENAGSGWWRISVFATADGVGSVPTVSPAVTGTDALSGYGDIAAGDSTSFAYFWGAQFEAGAFTTSYTPTTTAAVTRAADSASMTGTNFSSWYNASEGTFALEMTDEWRGRTTVYFCASLSGGSTDRFLYYLYTNLIQDQLDAGGVAYTNSIIGAIATSNIKIASRLKTNDYAASLNGAAVVADVGVTLPSLNELRFGVAQDGATFPVAKVWFKRLRYYNVGKTNTELQALTAL